MVMKKAEKPVTLRGIVIAVKWDENGKVIDAALSTHKEEEFRIAPDSKGRGLADCIQREVEVIGIMKKSNNVKTISITSYKVVGE